MLEHATPAVGSSVSTPPKALLLWFSAAVDQRASTVAVTGANCMRVDTHQLTSAAGDAKILETGLTAVMPGPYRVVWGAVSVDRHRTQGSFWFTVTK
jgi:methionine-rich copper-binding protein CopC